MYRATETFFTFPVINIKIIYLSLQDRLQRGALDCQDKARDKMSPSSSEADISKAKVEMEKCVVNCADNHIKMLPTLLQKMKDTITKGKYS